MKENIMDKTLARVNGEVGSFMSYINNEYGDVKPFNTEIMKPVDKLYVYDRLQLPENQDIKQQLILKYGYENYAEFEKIALSNRKARGL